MAKRPDLDRAHLSVNSDRTFDEPSDELVASIFIPELFERHAKHSGDHPVFVYESAVGSGEMKTVEWKVFNEACKSVADYVLERATAAGNPTSTDEPPVIGVLANLDTVTYCTVLSGIWLTGAVAFLISTRNSPAAIAHLLTETKTSTLLVSADPQMQSLAHGALATLPDSNIRIVPAPTHADLYGAPFEETAARGFRYAVTEDSPAMVLHSSGSTGFPKPITLTQRVLREWTTGLLQPDATLPVRGLRMACPAPIFHAIGVTNFLAAIRSGSTFSVFPPSDPPLIPNPQLVLNSAVATKVDVLWTVPALLELWIRNPSDVEKLKTFRAVAFGGGPLGRDVGNSLVAQGVPILNSFGGTEFGVACSFLSEPYPDWEWITMPSRVDLYFRPLEDESQFELIFLESDKQTQSVFNYEKDGVRGFATNDIVIRHPTHPRKIQILGRVDDQIMLSTGEKTNPGPIEAIIARNRLVAAAVMFGRGRDQNGIIIQPRTAIEPTDEAAITAFRNDIWSSVEEANAYAPTHSKLFKEMIIVSNPSKPFHFTPKNTIKRKPTLADYNDEIEAIYAAVEQSAQKGIAGPAVWNSGEVRDFVRRVVFKVMERELADDDDLFVHGGDSLQATWIRNSVLFAIRESPHASKVHAIGQDFVYRSPSITKLTRSILSLVGVSLAIDGTEETSDEITQGVNEIEGLVSEYTQDFPIHVPDSTRVRHVEGEVVLVTGTTGGLGAQILATLAAMPGVAKVYALNRPSHDGSAVERQRRVFVERGLDLELLEGEKVVVVEAILEKDDFGIGRGLYEEMRDSVTVILHTAWRVNFVLGISAFSPLIKGTRNIVDFSLSSPRNAPPRIIFTSSVGVYRTWNSETPPQESPVETRMALGNGYTRSKYVVERILESVGKETPLRPVIVRVGQLTSTESGAWNKSDWLPAIVRTGQIVGVLPDRNDDVSWIPLEVAANALWDFRNTSSTHLNLEHPTPYPWSSIFKSFSRVLSLPLVPWSEWLAKLEAAAVEDPNNTQQNPAFLLLDFFRAVPTTGTPGKAAPGNIPFLSLEKALASSEALRAAAVQQVDVEGDVEKWVAYWKSMYLLN